MRRIHLNNLHGSTGDRVQVSVSVLAVGEGEVVEEGEAVEEVIDEVKVVTVEAALDKDQVLESVPVIHHGARIYTTPVVVHLFNRPVVPAVVLSACILEVFKVFFTPVLVQLIVEQTNLYMLDR